MATSTATLDLTQFTKVWDVDFEDGTTGLLNLSYGHTWVHDGELTLSAWAGDGYQVNSGVMQSPSGASANQGYGLYSITMKSDPNEGPGLFACLWPSSNVWPGPELDMFEKQGPSSNTNAYSTIHWKGADGSDQYSPTMLGAIDVSQTHTYSMDWERDSITLYVDGQQIYRTTSHVPLDYADGGENSAFGVGMQAKWAANQQNGDNVLHVYDMNYMAPGGTGTIPDPHLPWNGTIGTGTHNLVLRISEDAYMGDAQYTVSVDGQQIGGTLTAHALHGAGSDTLTVQGNWTGGQHTVSVAFLNDAWGGTAATDRNLHLDGATYDGAALASSTASLLSNGAAAFTFSVAGTLPLPGPGGKTVQGTGGGEALVATNKDDVIVGGHGDDILTGFLGKDSFVFAPDDGHDMVRDFVSGIDKLVFQGVDASTVHFAKVSHGGLAGYDVHYGTGGDTIFLIKAAAVAASDLVFA
jgi:hypothetical protein